MGKSETLNLGIKRIEKSQFTTVKNNEDDVLSLPLALLIEQDRIWSDEGLTLEGNSVTLETSASRSYNDGNFPVVNFPETKFSW